MDLFFDTETTGIPRNYNAPISNVDNWPRLVQLGYIVMDKGEIVQTTEYIIKPNGFEIPVQASNVHGITNTVAFEDGVDLVEVLKDFTTWVEKCDVIVGHNISFDISVIGCEYFRLYGKSPLAEKKSICTMKSGTDFCQLPGPYGFKWPRLHELYFKLFGEEMGAAHTALQDIQNTAKCYYALVEKGIIKEQKEN